MNKAHTRSCSILRYPTSDATTSRCIVSNRCSRNCGRVEGEIGVAGFLVNIFSEIHFETLVALHPCLIILQGTATPTLSKVKPSVLPSLLTSFLPLFQPRQSQRFRVSEYGTATKYCTVYFDQKFTIVKGELGVADFFS